jgi:lipoic acid synthetase
MKPSWIKSEIPNGSNFRELKSIVSSNKLNTVCVEAKCPNIGECWNLGTLTFMILGDTCTRSCGFCAVKTGKGTSIDYLEPKRLARGIRDLKKNNSLISHIVLTSVNRDDKNYESAEIFASSIKEIKNLNLDIKVEVLIPDFLGKEECYKLILDAEPDVLNHNIETVERLYNLKQETGKSTKRSVRPQAVYSRSLELLEFFDSSKKIITKSGIMVGLGETKEEIFKCIDDLNLAGCQIITVGQYLQPSKDFINVSKFYSPEEFEEIKEYSEKKDNILSAECGPMVRSSYHAEKQLKNARLASRIVR